MSGASKFDPHAWIGRRGNVPYFLVGIEVVDVLLPIAGPSCLTIYCYLARWEYKNPDLNHSVREIASATGISRVAVARSLDILEHLQLVTLIRRGGCQESRCRLMDSVEAVRRLGAEYDPKTLSWTFPPEQQQRLRTEVKAIREKLQGKATASGEVDCGKVDLSVPQRDASVSLKGRQRTTRETQTGPHLLRKEERIEKILTPTAFHSNEAWKSEKAANEGGPVSDLLTWTRTKFTGVVKDVKNHFLGDGIYIRPLANGLSEWQKYGFESWGIQRAEWRSEGLVLSLSVSDVVLAKSGLAAYCQKWDDALEKWFKFKSRLEFVQARGGARQ